MEHIRQVAFVVVMRACGFGALAIVCVMFGTSFIPKFAFQVGGFLTTLMCGILILKAYEATIKDHRRTELWFCLEKERRPPADCAQSVSATVLRETYLRFALWTSAIAIVLWIVALLLPPLVLQ